MHYIVAHWYALLTLKSPVSATLQTTESERGVMRIMPPQTIVFESKILNLNW
jgi:hypothetical protein